MVSLYVPETDTVIRSRDHRYVHPQTGEVYGNTDYDDPQKLSEIGAIPLNFQDPAEGNVATGWEIVVAPDGNSATRQPTGEEAAPPPSPPDPEIELERTDQPMIRVTEDIIDVLISKGVMAFADLPQEAQDKIAERQNLRSQIDTAE